MTTSPDEVKAPRVRLSSLKADRDKEREGDWIPAVDIDSSIKWHVRSTNFAAFKIARDHKTQRLLRKYGDDPVPEDEMAKLNGELAVEHLLIGWSGLADDDENDIPFSTDKAREILTDEAYRMVRNSIFFAATKVGRSEVEFVGDAAKN